MTASLATIRRPGGGGGGGGATLTALASPSPAFWALVPDLGQFWTTISCDVTGGLAPYTINWNVLTGDAINGGPGPETFFASNSGNAGTVNASVTDANGATGTSNTVSISL